VPVGSTAEVFVPVGPGQTVHPPADVQLRGIADGYARFVVGGGSYVFSAAEHTAPTALHEPSPVLSERRLARVLVNALHQRRGRRLESDQH
jgi:hypothetical protein